MPRNMQLSWLEAKDSAERAAWVDVFRESNSITLGKAIARVFTERDAHWDWQAPMPSGSSQELALWTPPPPPRQRQRQNKKGKKGTKGGGKGKKKNGNLTPGTVAEALPSGAALCPDWQKGTCWYPRQAKCKKGLHKCGKVLSTGNICARPYHGAHKCKNT